MEGSQELVSLQRVLQCKTMADDPNLDSAYALSSPEDNVHLYRNWAHSYDSGFVREQGYRLHRAVARHFVACGGQPPVLDVGAGTGLCGAALSEAGIGEIHGTDISPDMLEVARTKGVYTTLFEANVLDRLPCETDSFAGAVSSGTFTLGHVGPEALDEVRRIVKPGGWIVISINAEHFKQGGFPEYFESNKAIIENFSLEPTRIYSQGAPGDHADDIAFLAAFQVV